MKKIILSLAFISFISCTKNDCDKQLSEAKNQYLQALSYAGGSATAQAEVTRQYNAKIESINKNCD